MTGPVQHDLLKPRSKVMEMPGVGALHGVSWMSGACRAEPADGRALDFAVRGLLRRTYTATEESGAGVGEYRRETAWRRNGSVTWYGREYEMVQTNAWRSLFALRRAERDLLTLKAYSMGPRRVSCRVTGAEAVEPGLELFCAWLVWRFAQEDASTAAASSG